MCQILDWGDETFETVGELKKKWPLLVREACYENPPEDDDCLCPVNIESTAAQYGVAVRRTVWGYEVIEGTA